MWRLSLIFFLIVRPDLSDGKPLATPNPVLYVAGGDGPSGCGPTEYTTNIFDLTAKKWCIGRNLPTALAFYGAVYYQSSVFLIGGNTGWCDNYGNSNQTYIFSPTSNGFSLGVPIESGMADVHAVVVGDTIYRTSMKAFTDTPARTHSLNGTLWQPGPPLTIQLEDYDLVSWKSTIWAIGGTAAPLSPLKNNLTLTTVSVWKVDDGSHAWVDGPSLLVDRDNPSAAVIGNSIYVCGGDSTYLQNGQVQYQEVTSCERLTLNDDGSIKESWTFIAPMLQTHSRASMVVYNGTLLVVGGRDQESEKWIEQYDPATNVWSQFTKILDPANIQDTRTVLVDDFPASSYTCAS